MPTVLLIDDDELGLHIREYLFNTAGHTVLAATTASTGLDLFRANDLVDLVVLDLNLPDMQGSEVLRLMCEERPSVPVIILSGVVNVGPETVALASAVVVKGEGAQRLLDECKRLTT